MIELGQLERRQDEFARRNTRVIAVSLDGPDDSRQTQARFPHLLVLSDQGRGLTNAVEVLHPHEAPDGGDADVPTTILVDGHGKVRWLYRSPEVLARLSPDDVLQAINQHMAATP